MSGREVVCMVMTAVAACVLVTLADLHGPVRFLLACLVGALGRFVYGEVTGE